MLEKGGRRKGGRVGWGSHKRHSEEHEVSSVELGRLSKVFKSDVTKAVF